MILTWEGLSYWYGSYLRFVESIARFTRNSISEAASESPRNPIGPTSSQHNQADNATASVRAVVRCTPANNLIILALIVAITTSAAAVYRVLFIAGVVSS